jgi:uncharacterized membrane protein YheB (UPF0754 family)
MIMAMKCKVCTHPDKKSIEQAILAGTPHLKISKSYDVPNLSVRNHAMHHLPERMVKAFQKREAMESLDMMNEFTTLMRDIKQQIEDFKGKGKDALTLRATETLIKLYQTMCQFASVYFQNQSETRKLANEQSEHEDREAFEKSLQVLSLEELQLLQALNEKLETQDTKLTVIPRITDFEPVLTNDLPSPISNITKAEPAFRTLKNRVKTDNGLQRTKPPKQQLQEIENHVCPLPPETITSTPWQHNPLNPRYKPED